MINEISCCGYRGFATEQKLTLAIPMHSGGYPFTMGMIPDMVSLVSTKLFKLAL
jgi:hypothetical protein